MPVRKRPSKSRPNPRSSSLERYARKRDFGRSPEPGPDAGTMGETRRFVVQQHAATRLHWDFRIEAGGVLKSWAVTKEPTLDPTVKRLAVRVEDHPLAYGTFAGDIPKGSYGAGHVDLWDGGTYEPKGDVLKGLKTGKVEVNLHGEKLNGMFALVRMGPPGEKENWLLIKMHDEFAAEKSSPAKAAKNATPAKTIKPVKSAAKVKSATRVEFTHVDKMMFPQASLTKGDVLDFYLRIADHLLPYLADRAVTLERLPDGLTSAKAPRFWQKNTPAYYPAWIPRVALDSHAGKAVQYAIVKDAEVLLYLVNQGAMTFHPFLSRVHWPDRPDFVLFDLDPGDAKFTTVVTLAKKLHEMLSADGVDAFLKTSGKSGLHVLTPWTKAGGFDDSRAWARGVAERVVEALPKLATTERSKSARRGRVYVDVMQNGPRLHVVPPYVLRAVPDATVSTPLKWSELTSTLNPKTFTPAAVLKRLQSQKADPFERLLGAIQSRAGD